MHQAHRCAEMVLLRKDEIGYLEALDINFNVIDNDALSENGVMADRTMNTLLHVFEAYTELYRVSGREDVKETKSKSSKSKFSNFSEREYDYDLLMKDILSN